MNYIIEAPWILVVVLGVILICGTVIFGCCMEKAIDDLLNTKHGYTDEHEKFPGI